MSNPFRMTVVLEYPSAADAPRVGRETKDFGPATVVALQFSDALLELEILHECAPQSAIDEKNADPRMRRMVADRMATIPSRTTP